MITAATAEGVRDLVKAEFPEDQGSPVVRPGAHEGLRTPGAWIVQWEVGPEGWAPYWAEATYRGRFTAPDGVTFEAINEQTLGLYPKF